MSEITTSNPIQAHTRVHALLERLHAQSTEQESKITKEKTYASSKEDFDDFMRDKFIALEQDKCWFAYQTIRAINAKVVVEAGTSFGVSTIYLALGVLDNIRAQGGVGKVITTENEPSKCEIAKSTWKEAGADIANAIELREGDLLQTLKVDLPPIDFLLLDIWSPIAYPTLQVVEHSLKPGAVVLIDNTISSASRYKDLLEHIRAPGSGYTSTTLPYHGGFEYCVYHGNP